MENSRRVNYLVKVQTDDLSLKIPLFLSFKVVQILFKEKLGELSGNAQRSLFQVLDRMIDTGRLVVSHSRCSSSFSVIQQ